jgi:hypothetical protein
MFAFEEDVFLGLETIVTTWAMFFSSYNPIPELVSSCPALIIYDYTTE